MKNWKLAPKNLDVAKFVDCFWFLEKERGDTGSRHPRLNPDPTAHLIIAADDYRFEYDQGDIRQEGSGGHWIFPHRKTYVMDHSDPFQIIGIKFRTGALYPLAMNRPETDLDQELDRIAAADAKSLFDLSTSEAESLLALAVQQPQDVCSILEDKLSPWLSHMAEDKHSELVRQVLPRLSDTPIAQIGNAIHRSQRTVERSFLRVTGLTLKQCHSMIRFEALLNHLYQLNTETINWVDLANQFEFSDQPHLIRYIKNTIGNTPGEYAKQRDLTIDVYGDFEFD